MRLRSNVKDIDSAGVVAVTVSNLSTTATNYAVALRRADKGAIEMIGFQTVGPDGVAMFLLRHSQTYAVAAFSDLNGNGVYDGGEPVALRRGVLPAPLSDTRQSTRPILLSLTVTNLLPPGQSFALSRENPDLGQALPAAFGEVARLDDPKFSSDVGEEGMWRPFEFLQQYGMGVYFLEPFRPDRIPVLFVYGISGSPQDWRPMFEKFDRTRYQLWFFQYPSGIRLDKSANALADALLLLRRRYECNCIDIVAHSMGGLVSRGAIQRATLVAGTNFIPHLVTISTPWAGHETAEMGVKYLDFPVPSWRDMVPGSPYLDNILSQPLPAGTRHDLLFSYKSSSEFGLPDENDGVVAVNSELLLQVEQQAASVLGLDEDHMSILASSAALKRVEESLAR